jgi:response regulator RpfG family c-di-GMP phosphodiesterase
MSSQNNAPAGTDNDELQRGTGKFVNVLVVGTDLSFAKAVQNALNTLLSAQPDTNFRVFPGVSKEKVLEYIAKYQLHSILVEEEFIDTGSETWLKDFRENLKKTPQNAKAPVILVVSKTDLKKTRATIKNGYTDMIVKPLDQSLFLQKMNMYNEQIKISDDSMLFSMEAKKDVDVGFYFETKSISEFGIKISSNKSVELDSIVTLYASFLEENVAAIVKECSKVSDDSYIVFMMFIGVTPAQTQCIRKFIRQEYAEEKQAS